MTAKEEHMRRMLERGEQPVTDQELDHLREQAEFMALGGQASAPHWRNVGRALAELQRRRAQDNAKEPA